MNQIADRKTLKNQYVILRHGKSKANELGIIISHPNEGTVDYGLVDEGKEQVKKSVGQAHREKILDSETIIFSSDFLRAQETARIAQEILGAKEMELEIALRERYFGMWDKTENGNYQKIWDDDDKNSGHTNGEVESVDAVLARTTGLIVDLEGRYEGKNILLVSHGDALQILQTAFEKMDPAQHRSVLPIETGEVRKLNF